GDRTLRTDLDIRLEAGIFLDGAEIESLIAYLRCRALDEELDCSAPTEAPTLATLSDIAPHVREFLKWWRIGTRVVAPVSSIPRTWPRTARAWTSPSNRRSGAGKRVVGSGRSLQRRMRTCGSWSRRLPERRDT